MKKDVRTLEQLMVQEGERPSPVPKETTWTKIKPIVKKALGLGAIVLYTGCATTNVTPNYVSFADQPKSSINYLQSTAGRMGLEWSLCGYGEEKADTVFVNKTIMPVIGSFTQNTVAFMPCDDYLGREEYLGMIHNHPGQPAIPSSIDANRFLNDKRAILEMIVGINGLQAWNKEQVSQIRYLPAPEAVER